ncbi:diguanylate cyclase [Piscinibacterium candidicorallinum]|uniref:diguanylate cyclase n=1 Tax=Piscinibacterium candidicorallinum TaxID=1793872 RepID=A0ABV7H9I6_9BURK
MTHKPLLCASALLLCAFCLHAVPAAASPAVIQLLDEAERLEARDPKSAMQRTSEALAALDAQGAAADEGLRRRALVQRCWLQASNRLTDPLLDVDKTLASPLFGTWDAQRAELRLCRGALLVNQRTLNEASREYEAVLAEAERLGNRALLADALTLRAEMRTELADHAAALADLQRAYDINTQLARSRSQQQVLNNIANLYSDNNVGAYEQAIDHYKRLLDLQKADQAERDAAVTLHNLAATYEAKKDFPQALALFRQGREIEQSLGLQAETMQANRAIARTLIKLGQPEDALPMLDEALRFFERAGDEDSVAQMRTTRGVALQALARPRDALVELNAALAVFERQSDDAFIEFIEGQRALAFAALGQWKAAAQARERQIALVRTLTEAARNKQFARLQVQFDTARKEEQNAALFAENTARRQALEDAGRIQRLQWLLIAVGGVGLLGLAAMTWRQLTLSRRMRDLALSDELTRLPNRRNLLAQAQLRMDQADEDKVPLSVLAIDIDHFKRVNDVYGHEAGDLVLRRVAQACTGALRTNDVIGRVGGEEFVAVLSDADREVARAVAERMRSAVEALRFPDVDPGLRVTISLGVAQRGELEPMLAPLAARADAALYRAKQAGRNRIEE